jgi:D-alanyl-D-alanine carboxypeptidase/D-alanyl-D-alanine-endopeptidase (penicillin-binding protein 4)
VGSPALSSLVESTNKPSNNFFAEMLLKELGAAGAGKGTTDRGARRTRRFAAKLGARARIVDGSGLAHQNRATPRNVVDLLVGLDRRKGFAAEFAAFKGSLPVAGVDGTLSDRMRGGPAEGRCQAKTGTLTNVSALSGYCRSKGGDRLVFSFLMNDIDVGLARNLQDRMTNALARYRG